MRWRGNNITLAATTLGYMMFGSMNNVAQGTTSDIFQLVQTLARSHLLPRPRSNALLGVNLEVVNDNRYFVFLAGNGPKLPDGTAVQSIDL